MIRKRNIYNKGTPEPTFVETGVSLIRDLFYSPFAVQMVREKIGALRVMPTREEIQKLLAIRMQTGAGLVEFTHSHNLHKIISTHLLTWLIAGAIVGFR